MNLFLKLSCMSLLIGLVLAVQDVHAQTNVHPQQAKVKIRLQAIRVEGFEVDDHPDLSREDLESRIALERGRFDKEVTIEDIHVIADALTLYFRNQGYAFHSVFLPPQTVQAGLVMLKLQPGVLGDVHVINNSRYKDSAYTSPFAALLNQTLYAPSVEQAVQALKMQGDATVFAFFSRGTKPGEARLNLRVDDTSKRSFRASMDNYGSDTSGKHRLIAAYTERQLTGHHDTLSLSLLRVLDDIDNTYGNIHYKLPFAGLRYELTGSFSNNQFEVGDRLAALGLRGETTTLSLGLTRYFDFHPRSRSSVQVYLAKKQSDLKNDSGIAQEENSQSVTFEWQKRWQSDTGKWMLQSSMDLAVGDFDGDSAAPTNNFTKLSISEFLIVGSSKGWSRNVLQMSLRGQYSQDEVPVADAMSMTGIYGVRGFEPSAFNADRGAITSLEWRWPNLWVPEIGNWRIEPFLHADLGYGEDGLDDTLSRATYASAGLGVRLNIGKHVSTQLIYAEGLDGQIDEDEVADDAQVLFEIRVY